MKCFEMYGLPGAGKTTISVPVINRLRGDGLKVADLTDIYYRNCNNGKKTKVVLEMLLSVKRYPLYFGFICYGLSVPKTTDSMKYLFKLLVFVHQLIKTTEKELYDLVLCEEGVIQHLTSLCYNRDLPDTKLLKKCLSRLNKDVDIEAIDCVISIEDSLNRINGRGVGSSRRFSSASSSEILRSVLNTKERNLALVARCFSSVHLLSMEHSKENCENELYSLIKNVLE